jgi:hypothetical protein
MAARRLRKSEAEFEAVLPNLIARGFPKPDPIPATSISMQLTPGAALVIHTYS